MARGHGYLPTIGVDSSNVDKSRAAYRTGRTLVLFIVTKRNAYYVKLIVIVCYPARANPIAPSTRT